MSHRDNEETEYWPRWDRRRELDATVILDGLRSLSVSLRATVATGAPFWLPVGRLYGLRYDPRTWEHGENTPENPLRGLGPRGDFFAILSDAQGRVPYYGRVDLSARYVFRWGQREIVPFVSVPNITNRENVLTYRPSQSATREGNHLVTEHQIPLFPFLGVDFRF